jgi:hypothetical protein
MAGLGLIRDFFRQLPEPTQQRLYRILRPRALYHLLPSTKPISRSFWTDRGQPVDRYFIEQFLDENRQHIFGDCLEVLSPAYLYRFGHDLTRVEVLDIDRKNPRATIYGDLRRLGEVPSDSFDCVILTQVLQYIDDLDAAASELIRILKPGGTALVTVPALMKRDMPERGDCWRFTMKGLRYVFARHVPDDHMQTKSWGNVLTGMAAWIGLAQEDLKVSQLEEHDPSYPCMISMRVTKPAPGAPRG